MSVEHRQPTRSSATRKLVLSAIAGACVLAVLFAMSNSTRRSSAATNIVRDLARARNAARAGRFDEASAMARQILTIAPGNQDAMFVAAEAETKLGNFEDAVELYDQITNSKDAVQARAFAAEIERHVGHLNEAVRRFQALLLDDPQNALAHRRLAWIFNVFGCRNEAQAHLFELCQQQNLNLDELVLLSDRERLVEFGDEVSSLAEQNQQAVGIRLGMARQAYQEGRVDAAEAQLQKLQPYLQQSPDWLVAEFQVLTGRIYLDNDQQKNLEQWRISTLTPWISHPDLWLLHGEVLAIQGHPDSIDCLRTAIAMAPNSQRAHYQMASALVVAGQEKDAEKFRDRANLLRELAQNLNLVATDSSNMKAMLEASRLCGELGRPWEAVAWQAFARQLVPPTGPPDWAMDALSQNLPTPVPFTPQTLETACLCSDALETDTTALLDRLRQTENVVRDRNENNQTAVTFRDAAKDVGLEFQYQTGLAGRLSGRPMYSFPGGGVGVIDFDLDAWPDLYIPQGTTWPPSADNAELVDGLCRNIRGSRSRNVADLAGVTETRFSHGVAVGDFDNDGFPDVYVANIFRNRLYKNLGDGTFAEVDVPAFPNHGWTTSCVIADLSGDGLPDLYDVNYARGEGIYEKVCEHNGVKGTCTPMAFEPEADVFFLNNGDGTFSDQTQRWGMNVEGGNGLGVIAADLNGDGRCDLFVANDADPNFLFVRDVNSGFSQIAQSAGVAVDGGGTPQACMGTATADADGDQRLDLFVTNYYQEHNVLYSQVADGVFVDASSRNGLYGAGYSMLGFGTQFIDADLDTWPDLFVANGHVDDFRHTGADYAMKPQFFSNMGDGMFEERSSTSAGPYFSAQYLGRGAARLDWNADGRPDVAVSHLDHPIALLLNDTQTDHHFLKLCIRKTSGDRDGVGTAVHVTTGVRTIAEQFVAGSGYMASNENTVLTGVGDQSASCDVAIVWQGTGTVEYKLNPDRCWILIQGRAAAYEVPY